LERNSRIPLHEQLEQLLREQVRGGWLAPGTRLPSSRALASELGISRGIVVEAYAQLTAEGYLTSSQGAPTRVAATPSTERPPVPASSLEPLFEHDLRPGVPDLVQFPRDRWMRSLRAAARAARFDELGPVDPRGSPALRNELMSYLGRVRGAAPEPEHTIICSGFSQGFATLCRVLADRGVQRIAIEDPGSPEHRLIAERAGVEPVPVPVDELGIDVEALGGSGCEVAVVTPAHQFPTGVVLASDRRAALLEWAEDEDALIVEDDYDSELRYDRGSVGALQGLAPERICQIGDVSKRLAPGVALGWVLSPSWLTGALTYERALSDSGPPMLDQLALADFIRQGELDRHLRRMRLSYRPRREAIVSELARVLPNAHVSGISAGLFVPALLAHDLDEDAILSAAAASGLGLDGLGAHRLAGTGDPGLLLGFGVLTEQGIRKAVGVLGGAIRAAASPEHALTGI
jgi:GntR family transcriptional regulator / MocR family aminotransferase